MPTKISPGTSPETRPGKSRVARQPEEKPSRRSVCVACHVAQVARSAPRASIAAMHSPLLHPSRLAFWGLCLAFLLTSGCDKDASSSSADSAQPAALKAATPASVSTQSPAPALPDPAPGPDGKVRLSEDEWRARLTPEQFKILRGAATERPFSCPLWKISEQAGVYHCAGCGLALFDSADKFDSGTGWPSFSHPVAPDRILEQADNSYGMTRVETLCARCEGHLGHVFDDGPPPSGRRYCINGSVLRFEPRAEAPADTPSPPPAGTAPAKAQP